MSKLNFRKIKKMIKKDFNKKIKVLDEKLKTF